MSVCLTMLAVMFHHLKLTRKMLLLLRVGRVVQFHLQRVINPLHTHACMHTCTHACTTAQTSAVMTIGRHLATTKRNLKLYA